MSTRESLDALRDQIMAVDEELIRLLGRRLELVREIGKLKRELGLQVLDPEREASVVRRAAASARDRGVDPELVRDVYWRIIDHARGIQRSEEP